MFVWTHRTPVNESFCWRNTQTDESMRLCHNGTALLKKRKTTIYKTITTLKGFFSTFKKKKKKRFKVALEITFSMCGWCMSSDAYQSFRCYMHVPSLRWIPAIKLPVSENHLITGDWWVWLHTSPPTRPDLLFRDLCCVAFISRLPGVTVHRLPDYLRRSHRARMLMKSYQQIILANWVRRASKIMILMYPHYYSGMVECICLRRR